MSDPVITVGGVECVAVPNSVSFKEDEGKTIKPITTSSVKTVISEDKLTQKLIVSGIEHGDIFTSTQLTNELYHASEGISKTGLTTILSKTPAHYKYAEPKKQTKPMRTGELIHTATLEPDRFKEDFARDITPLDYPDALAGKEEIITEIMDINSDRLPKLATGGSKDELIQRIIDSDPEAVVPEKVTISELKGQLAKLNENREGLLPTRGSEADLINAMKIAGYNGVEFYADIKSRLLTENAERTILKQEEYDKIVSIADSVRETDVYKMLGQHGHQQEISVYANDPITGELCKCRIDLLSERMIMVDIKKCRDASPEGFAKAVANYRYDMQAAFYMDVYEWATGKKMKDFGFLAVEEEAPYCSAFYFLPDNWIEHGRKSYRKALNLYAECKESDVWPGYTEQKTLEMPYWVEKQLESENGD